MFKVRRVISIYCAKVAFAERHVDLYVNYKMLYGLNI
jgi:hypothetical protein